MSLRVFYEAVFHRQAIASPLGFDTGFAILNQRGSQ
jgi:hypothetical protein